jgi:hypothetical protein
MDDNCPPARPSTPTDVSEVALSTSLVKLELNQQAEVCEIAEVKESGYEILVMALMRVCLENQPGSPKSFQHYFRKFSWTHFKLLPGAKDAMDRAKEELFGELEVHSLSLPGSCSDRIFFRKTEPDWVLALIGQDFLKYPW